jgi:hypothetical protein
MTPHPQTGLVEVLDLATKPPTVVKMWPVDARETFQKRVTLDDSKALRFVLAETYTAPEPEPEPTPDKTSPAKAPA